MTRSVLLGMAVGLAVGCTDGEGNDVPPDGVTDPDPIPVPVNCDDTSFTQVRPDEAYITEEVLGMTVFHWLPDNPRAIVVLFHGSGGDIGDIKNTHHTRIENIFRDAGIGFIGTESVDRQAKKWELTNNADNPDMVRIGQLRDHFMAQTDWNENTPMIGSGYSNGAGFADSFIQVGQQLGWPVVASIHHNNSFVGNHDMPAMFISSENDQGNNNEGAYDDHIASGKVAEFHLGLERAWTPQDMLLHPSYDELESQAVFDELVEFDMIDANGDRVSEINQIERLMDSYAENSLLPGPNRVIPLLRVAWADHRVTSEFACEERDFILDAL